jgi:hypothetical protein
MTPEQQAALEAVAGRQLSADDIVQIEPLLMAGDMHGIAEALSVGRVKLQSKEIGIGTILAVMAPAGGAFLDALESLGATDRNVYWSMELIRQGRFDIGMPAARDQVRVLADTNPAIAPGITALLAVAEASDPLHAIDIVRALGMPEVV